MKMTLKACRINAGYTQVEAAAKLGISDTTLRLMEQGKRFPDVPLIQKIEELYGVTYDSIKFLPN